MKGARPNASAAIGGAIAVSYQRWGGQTCSGSSVGGGAEDGRIAAGGVVIGIERLRRLAGGHLQARRAQLRQETGGHPCLPDIGPRADDGDHPAGAHAGQSAAGVAAGRGNSASAWSNRLTSSSLCAADRVTRRRLVPTGTVGGRMAGTHKPSSSSAADAESAACSLPSTTGMIGLGCPGGAKPASATRSIRRRGGPSGRRLRRNAGPRARRGPPRRRPAWARWRRCTSGPG